MSDTFSYFPGDDDYCPECGSSGRPALTVKRGGGPGEMERCKGDFHAPPSPVEENATGGAS